ncbi:MAG: dihydropteroate synthase [Bacillota bacterium]
MIIIGEKLNSSIPKTFQAMQKKDEKYILQLISMQEESGADYLDINTAICGKDELQIMEWIVDLVLKKSNCGIMVDSPSSEIILKVISNLNNRKFIINSLSLCERINELLPIVVEKKCGIVALPIGADGMPKTYEEKIENSIKLIDILTSAGVFHENIYLDILAEAIATDYKSGQVAIETIRGVRTAFPKVHITCGLSNISFGLPKRSNINNAFLASAVTAGLDSVIIDITNASTKQMLFSSLAIAGKDEFCMDYLNISR